MATIVATVTQGGQSDATKTFNLADADLTRIVAAYQSDANVSVNGTATRVQVLNYIFNTVLVAPLKEKTRQFETVPAVVPAVIAVT